MQIFDPATVRQAIQDTLEAGTWDGNPIRVVVGGAAELRPPCVQLLPPGLEFDPLGEGFVVTGSNWPLICWYSIGGELDVDGEAAFALAVTAALQAGQDLGGYANGVSGSYPTEAPPPLEQPVGNEDSPRSIYRRIIQLHVDHT